MKVERWSLKSQRSQKMMLQTLRMLWMLGMMKDWEKKVLNLQQKKLHLPQHHQEYRKKSHSKLLYCIIQVK